MFPYEVWSAVFVARVIWASSLHVYRQDICIFRCYGFLLFSQPRFFPLSPPYKPLFWNLICSGSLIFFGAAFSCECWKMDIISLYFPKVFCLTVLRFVAFNLWTPTLCTYFNLVFNVFVCFLFPRLNRQIITWSMLVRFEEAWLTFGRNCLVEFITSFCWNVLVESTNIACFLIVYSVLWVEQLMFLDLKYHTWRSFLTNKLTS